MTKMSDAARYDDVRARTMALCAPLEIEDYMVQSMEDTSPARWHLAHTTWFFETFVLRPHSPTYQVQSSLYAYLFNSYYNGVGAQFPRPRRGTQSRPTVAQVVAWRRRVDDAMSTLLQDPSEEVVRLTTIGVHHEEQHQELLVTDLKHGLGTQPTRPVYREDAARPAPAPAQEAPGAHFDAGMVEVGHHGEGFCFDNETPAHQTWLAPYRLDGELVTNAQWMHFMQDGGYQTHALWLSDGWDVVRRSGWRAPLYWFEEDGQWMTMTMGGARPVTPHAPVTHVSFFEADAFARWAGARLPTEQEWEHAARSTGATTDGTMLEDQTLHPVGRPAPAHGGLRHLFGEVWEWTASAYRPYPGYKAPPGALGEYNGKFMNGTYVLRGGSCATSRAHIRAGYRNFFGPDKRWQFTGLRLAHDL